jgi:hypothetical protein
MDSMHRLSLLPVSDEMDPDLEAQLKRDYKEALRYLVMGQTPVDVIKKREGRGKKLLAYVPGYWFVQQANGLFGHLWSQEVKEFRIDTEGDQVVALVKVSILVPGKVIEEHRPDGTVIITRYESLTVSKEQFGGSDVKRKFSTSGKGKLIDLADDCKAAATDGMKKCLSLFGFARDVYSNQEKEQAEGAVDGPDETYVKVLAKTTKLGWDEAHTMKWAEEIIGKKFEEISPTDFVMLLGKVPKS